MALVVLLLLLNIQQSRERGKKDGIVDNDKRNMSAVSVWVIVDNEKRNMSAVSVRVIVDNDKRNTSAVSVWVIVDNDKRNMSAISVWVIVVSCQMSNFSAISWWEQIKFDEMMMMSLYTRQSRLVGFL